MGFKPSLRKSSAVFCCILLAESNNYEANIQCSKAQSHDFLQKELARGNHIHDFTGERSSLLAEKSQSTIAQWGEEGKYGIIFIQDLESRMLSLATYLPT